MSEETVEETLQKLKHLSMTEAEFSENARLAVPALLNRAIELAKTSTSIKDVMAVAHELMDRGYGKVAKEHDTSEKSDFIRIGWKSMAQENRFLEHSGLEHSGLEHSDAQDEQGTQDVNDQDD